MPNPKPYARPAWADSATLTEIEALAPRVFSACMEVFSLGHAQSDNPLMLAAVKDMRGIVTRLDRFRRVAVRRWTAAASAQTQPPKGNT